MKRTAKLVLWIVLACPVPAALGQQSADPLAQARALLASGKLQQSEDVLDAYLKANPASADAHFLLGYVEFREQKARESLAEFTAGAKYRRPQADELMTVASDYVMLGDYVDADQWFSAVTKEKPGDADAWYLLGRTKYSESDYRQAIACFERALSLRPQYIEAENNLGLAWRDLNDMEKAAAAFQTAIAWQGQQPLDPQPFLNLGTLLDDQSDFTKALVYLMRARDLSPDNPRIHEELARAYEGTNNLGQAQSELERAITLAPKASALHFKLARVYRREGLEEQAKREFELCEKLNGTQSSVDTPNPPKHSSPD
jgi:tetratricopeptide (TPR) repeat protein